MKLTWDSPLRGVEPQFATADHPVWAEIAPTAWRPGGFTREEFSDPDEMDAHFLRWLWEVRRHAEVPFRVISSARDPEGAVGAKLSPHKKRPCRAVDLQAMNNYERARIVIAASVLGCRRIGVYPADANGKGGVHLDASALTLHPSPRMWTRY